LSSMSLCYTTSQFVELVLFRYLDLQSNKQVNNCLKQNLTSLSLHTFSSVLICSLLHWLQQQQQRQIETLCNIVTVCTIQDVEFFSTLTSRSDTCDPSPKFFLWKDLHYPTSHKQN
jgi:hypothetical protein